MDSCVPSAAPVLAARVGAAGKTNTTTRTNATNQKLARFLHWNTVF